MPNRRILKWVAVGLGVIIVALAVWYNLELRPVGPKGAPERLFTVDSGSSAPEVGRELKAAGLIRSKDAFITYLGIHGLRSSIKAGQFNLSPADSTGKIAQIVAGSGLSAKQLVVPPGSTLVQIEAAAAAQGITSQAFELALSATHAQGVLSTKPAGVSLEGYLFPDSYDVGAGMTADRLVNTMINNLQAKLTPDIIQKWQSEGLSIHQGLTLASIVEKEVASKENRPIVAQIFLSRLKQGMPLGSDVTAFYASALAGQSPNVTIDSPYNTRLHAGLPPGPICSPSLEAMEAVANPAHTSYLYFLAGRDGKIYYAKTYAQHLKNIQEHL